MKNRSPLRVRCRGRVTIAAVPLAFVVVAHGASGSTIDASTGGPLRLDLSAVYLASASADETASAEPMTPTPQTDTGDLAKQLSNPVASLISVPFQFNLDSGFGPKDAERLTLNIQPVIPFSLSEDWNLISRTIVPIIYQGSIADGLDSDFGMGDVLQSFFFSPTEPVGGWILGAGPVALLPTGTTPNLRSESLGLGPTAVALRQEGGLTFGALANHIWSVTKSDDREDISRTFLQPFVSYSWPNGTSLSLNSESQYDWQESEWTVPINLVVAQILKFGDLPVQLQLGGRYYAESPAGGPEWGVRFGFVLLFPR
jgi:hypothetical protein